MLYIVALLACLIDQGLVFGQALMLPLCVVLRGPPLAATCCVTFCDAPSTFALLFGEEPPKLTTCGSLGTLTKNVYK